MAPEYKSKFEGFLNESQNTISELDPFGSLNFFKCDSFSLAMIIIRCVLPRVTTEEILSNFIHMNANENLCKEILKETTEFVPVDIRSHITNMLDYNSMRRLSTRDVWKLVQNLYPKFYRDKQDEQPKESFIEKNVKL
jgi:hypothetical protein